MGKNKNTNNELSIQWLKDFIRFLSDNGRLIRLLPLSLGGKSLSEDIDANQLISEIMVHLKNFEEKGFPDENSLKKRYHFLNLDSVDVLEETLTSIIIEAISNKKICVLDCNMVSRFNTVTTLLDDGYEAIFSLASLLEVNAWDTKKSPIGSDSYIESKPIRSHARKQISHWLKDTLSLYEKNDKFCLLVIKVYQFLRSKNELSKSDKQTLCDLVESHLRVPVLFYFIEHYPDKCVFGNNILFRDDYRIFVDQVLDSDMYDIDQKDYGYYYNEIFPYVRTAAIRLMVNKYHHLHLTLASFNWLVEIQKIHDEVTFEDIEQYEKQLTKEIKVRQKNMEKFVDQIYKKGFKHGKLVIKGINDLSFNDLTTFDQFVTLATMLGWPNPQDGTPEILGKKNKKHRDLWQKYKKLYNFWQHNQENMTGCFSEMIDSAGSIIERALSEHQLDQMLNVENKMSEWLKEVVTLLIVPDVRYFKKKIEKGAQKTRVFKRLPSVDAVRSCHKKLLKELKKMGYPNVRDDKSKEKIVTWFKRHLVLHPDKNDPKIISGISDKFDVNDFSMVLEAKLMGAQVLTANNAIQDQVFIDWRIAYFVHDADIIIDNSDIGYELNDDLWYYHASLNSSIRKKIKRKSVSDASKSQASQKNTLSPKTPTRKTQRFSKTPSSSRFKSKVDQHQSPYGTPARKDPKREGVLTIVRGNKTPKV